MKISKLFYLLISIFLFNTQFLNGQSNTVDIKKTDGTKLLTVTEEGKVGIGTSSPEPSALLEVKSTAKGVLFPRMTEVDRSEITNPVVGLIIFNTSTNCLNYYTGTEWFELCGNSDCINSGGADCSSSIDLGTVCGDASSGNILSSGCGDAWYSFVLSECELSPPNPFSNLTVKITLVSPTNVNYDLLLYDEQCGTAIALSKEPSGIDEITFSISDEEYIDDSKELFIEIRKIDGVETTNWNLTIEGNVSI